jgi:hypothetical protein
MDEVGHFLHMEKPAEVNAKLMEFIGKVARWRPKQLVRSRPKPRIRAFWLFRA